MTNQTGEGTYNYKMLSLILGDKDFSGGRVPTGEPNLAGIFYSAQSIFKGSLKIVGITGILPITKGKDGALSIPMNGYEIEYVEPGRYKITINDSMSMLMYADVDSDGHVHGFSLATGDYIRTNWGAVIFDIVPYCFL